jgi:hypothetical protein
MNSRTSLGKDVSGKHVHTILVVTDDVGLHMPLPEWPENLPAAHGMQPNAAVPKPADRPAPLSVQASRSLQYRYAQTMKLGPENWLRN